MKVIVVTRRKKPRWTRVAAQRLFDRMSECVVGNKPQEVTLRCIESEYRALRTEEVFPACRRGTR